MSRHENVENSIWSDPEWLELTPHAKLLYLWTWTNPRCGMAGIYKMALSAAAMETGLELDRVREVLDELREARFCFYEDKVLWVRARVKHLRTRTPQIARSVVSDVEHIDPAHPLRVRFIEAYADDPWLREQFAVMAPPGGWETATYVSRAQRERIFTRDEWRCVDCASVKDLTIDHVTPGSHGGDNSDGNLATRCRGCNARKGPRGVLALQAEIREPLYRSSIGGSNRGSNKNLPGNGNGNSNGKGKGGPGGKPKSIDWGVWCSRHVPELPPTFAVSAARALHAAGIDVEPDTVRRRVHAQHDWTADEGEPS
jgi:hypothetical protein